jgi:Domain of unknown function (DUF1707)
MYDDAPDGIRSGGQPNLRASDADREAFGERLRSHHADGRLNTEEFQERIDRCYSAKTVGELEQLVTDLPAERRREPRSPVRWIWGVPLVPVVIAVALVVGIFGAGHHGHGGVWSVLAVMLVLRVMLVKRFRRAGVWRGPERQM